MNSPKIQLIENDKDNANSEKRKNHPSDTDNDSQNSSKQFIHYSDTEIEEINLSHLADYVRMISSNIEEDISDSSRSNQSDIEEEGPHSEKNTIQSSEAEINI